MFSRKFIPILFLLMLQGCALFAPDAREMAPSNLPARFTLYEEAGTAPPDRWWEQFGNSDLNLIVERALGGNFSIREAWARLEQARAEAAKAGADLWPTLSINAGAERSRTENSNQTGRTSNGSVDEFSIGPTASYELDLWGRVRSLREAEALGALASRADLDAAAMTVAAQVVDAWIDLLSTAEQIRLLGTQIETNAAVLELLELRFEKSLATILDVLQQREALIRLKAQIPPLEARQRILANSLAFLLGEPPGKSPTVESAGLPGLPPLPETGLPADLLARRPDVQAAGLRLQSADWVVAAARADRLPAISLTGRFIYSGETLGTVFDGWLATLAANIVGPVFDAGRRKAEVDRTRAVVDERLAAYERTVTTAVREVEDALVSEEKQKEGIVAVREQLDAARLALEEAEYRYLKGLDNFIPMLTERDNVQSLERNLIVLQADLLKFRTALHRALGGGWTSTLKPSGLKEEKG